MFKKFFSAATPLACVLSVALAPLSVSAAPSYNNNCCADTCCEPDPCCDNKRGWFRDAAIFLGAAAVGAVAGVVAANSSKRRGNTGDLGPVGPTGLGATGPTGPTGAGFVIATVPPGQPDEGAPVTSLTFTFTTTSAITDDDAASFLPYVTTPDGITTVGTTPFSGLAGSTATVDISGTLYTGQYDVGFIGPSGVTTIVGTVSVEVTSINTNPISTLADVGVVSGPGTLPGDTFFNAQYPFENVPVFSLP